jgi:hypothetical protein
MLRFRVVQTQVQKDEESIVGNRVEEGRRDSSTLVVVG